MRIKKKLLSAFLALAMVFSLFAAMPLTASAATNNYYGVLTGLSDVYTGTFVVVNANDPSCGYL